MSRSSALRELPGALAGGLFSRKGLVEEFEGPFSASEADALAGLCSAITLTMEMQGLLLDRLTGQPGWNGCYGWATWGSERAIAAVGEGMCILDTRTSSFNEVFSAMRRAAGVAENGD
jgi:roadblock/LC7 domain-containing protein